MGRFYSWSVGVMWDNCSCWWRMTFPHAALRCYCYKKFVLTHGLNIKTRFSPASKMSHVNRACNRRGHQGLQDWPTVLQYKMSLMISVTLWANQGRKLLPLLCVKAIKCWWVLLGIFTTVLLPILLGNCSRWKIEQNHSHWCNNVHTTNLTLNEQH